MANFMELMNKNLEERENRSITENGAVGYKSSGHGLLDLNFSVSSMRKMPVEQIIEKWTKAYSETPELAMRWLFFLRDAREGLGERRTYRIIMDFMAKNCPMTVAPLAAFMVKSPKNFLDSEYLIPFYGRWDDMFPLLDTPLNSQVMGAIRHQFALDWKNYLSKQSPYKVSLLAKWMPSISASSKKSSKLAMKLARTFRMKPSAYRKRLSLLRERIDVVERKMTNNEWDRINYAGVPSRANVLYAKAFLKHDHDRRQAYVDAVISGQSKMNAGVVYPYEIVYKLRNAMDDVDPAAVIQSMEAMWKSLPNTITDPTSKTIVVRDGSGSMLRPISKSTNAMALDVSTAMAIYFSERLDGEFKDKFITFSHNPDMVDLSDCRTLKSKIERCWNYDEAEDTNVEGVFDLILDTAVKNNLRQEDIPSNILILSDMEFNYCVRSNSGFCREERDKDYLFSVIAKKWEEAGYKLPRVVFWNICSTTGTIPMKENKYGVALVSGFSPNIATMVMSGKTDPWECMVDQLMSPRYDAVSAALGHKIDAAVSEA